MEFEQIWIYSASWSQGFEVITNYCLLWSSLVLFYKLPENIYLLDPLDLHKVVLLYYVMFTYSEDEEEFNKHGTKR